MSYSSDKTGLTRRGMNCVQKTFRN